MNEDKDSVLKNPIGNKRSQIGAVVKELPRAIGKKKRGKIIYHVPKLQREIFKSRASFNNAIN